MVRMTSSYLLYDNMSSACRTKAVMYTYVRMCIDAVRLEPRGLELLRRPACA